MRGLVVFGLLVATVAVCVLSETDQHDDSAVAVSAEQLEHGHRSKRSPVPYDPIIPALVVGKSFLLGAIVGKTLRKGWGWRPRVRGWGWAPRHHHHHTPVVVSHTHSHGGWGGWEEPVSHGWGWSR